MGHTVLPVSPALTEARMGATRRVLTSISPSLSRRCSGRNFAAGTWMHSTLLSLEKPPRPEPWRTRTWLTWPSALDWRISSEYSTGERINRLQNLVDVNSFAPAGISYSDSEFGGCGPYSRVDSALPVGGWQGLVANQSVALGSGKPEFRCFSVAEQDPQSIRCSGYSPVGSQPKIASAA